MLGVVAVFFFPIVLGPAGVVLGIMARQRGERLATVAIVVGVAGLVVGMFVAAALYNASR